MALNTHTCTRTHTPHTHNHFTFTPIVVINHPLSASSIFYDPRNLPRSIYVPFFFYNLHPKFSLVYLFFCLPLAWHPPLHAPYISSLNHCLLLAAHAHIVTNCSAVVPKLRHLILVSLSTVYLELYLIA